MPAYIPTGKKGKVKKSRLPDSVEIAYTIVVLLLAVPLFRNIPVWLNVLLNATVLIYLGGLLLIHGVVEDSGEAVSQKDAMKFPLYGSAVLFGLFVVFKFIAKEYVNALLSLYFLFLGFFAISEVIRPVVSRIRPYVLVATQKREVSYTPKAWPAKLLGKLTLKYSNLDITCWTISAVICIAYGLTKFYLLNNFLGYAFSLEALTLLNLGSFKVGAMLLSGLFFYDIFWVFFTPVMVSVAKNLDAPIKLLFAKDILAEKVEFSMLGLGDIVIPGAFIMLLLRFDQHLIRKGVKAKFYPYFHAGMVGYVIGLIATWVALVVFESAQPALLYLVPTCLGAAYIMAQFRGEFSELWNFHAEVKKKGPAPAPSTASSDSQKSGGDDGKGKKTENGSKTNKNE